MEGRFNQKNLENKRYSVLIDEQIDARILVVTFGGKETNLSFPITDYMRSLDTFPVTKVFIRDFEHSWYLNGIPGVSNGPSETLFYLKKLISRFNPSKTIFIGSTFGGYAAMLYGNMLKVDEVHAFSSQSFLNGWNRLTHLDGRWKNYIRRLNPNASDFLDLKKYFRENRSTNTNFHMYWDCTNHLDSVHASRMNFSNFYLHGYPFGGPTIMKSLFENGELQNIVRNFVLDSYSHSMAS
ncbi:hypothetical protein KFE98_17805 [bacterium SCSIO 12741]|nr:hypothetical protein KFE98_17805 [bacterium SCSIO 12741]